MACRKKYTQATKEQVVEALRNNGGIVGLAAAKLNVTRRGLYARIQRDPELKEIVEDAREALIDSAEKQLSAKVKRGNIAAIIFTLKSLGKTRGYSEKQEVDVTTGGEAITTVKLVQVVKPEDVKNG